MSSTARAGGSSSRSNPSRTASSRRPTRPSPTSRTTSGLPRASGPCAGLPPCRRVRWWHSSAAIADWNVDPEGEREWRTHFHVPVFLDDLGELRTTRREIEAALAVHGDIPLSDHLEIETYTWDVLPAHLKTGDITDYVCRE